MKNTYMTMLGLALAAPVLLAAPATPSAEEAKETTSYIMGLHCASMLAQQLPGLEAQDIDTAVFAKALTDALSGNQDAAILGRDIEAAITVFEGKVQERAGQQGVKNAEAGKAYREANSKKEGVTTTASGLQYKVLTAGEGRKYDEKTDGVDAECAVTYEGRLIDGKVFDKSETPITFPINRVVPGFTEALKLMPIGSEWEVTIPSELAYGEQGPGIMGPNATLIFKMKLHDIKAAAGKAGNPIELTPEIEAQLREQGLLPVE